jgi:hypothetical protein
MAALPKEALVWKEAIQDIAPEVCPTEPVDAPKAG